MAPHTDERTFVFGEHPTFYNISEYNMTSFEETIKQTMMEVWTNFAKTG